MGGGVAGAPDVVGVAGWPAGSVWGAGVGAGGGVGVGAGVGGGAGVDTGFGVDGGAVGLGATGIVCGGFGCGGVIEGAGAGADELAGIIGPAYFANTLRNSDGSETLFMRNLGATAQPTHV